MTSTPLQTQAFACPTDDVDDLFACAGIRLVDCPSPRGSGREAWRPIAGSPFKVWRNVDHTLRPYADDSRRQPLLDFPPAGPVRLIPKRLSAFLNADIRTVLVASFRDRAAAAHLARQGIHYLGDLTLMSPFELLPRLGPNAAAFEAIEEALASVGLALQGQAPWWRRPLNYYARAR